MSCRVCLFVCFLVFVILFSNLVSPIESGSDNWNPSRWLWRQRTASFNGQTVITYFMNSCYWFKQSRAVKWLVFRASQLLYRWISFWFNPLIFNPLNGRDYTVTSWHLNRDETKRFNWIGSHFYSHSFHRVMMPDDGVEAKIGWRVEGVKWVNKIEFVWYEFL